MVKLIAHRGNVDGPCPGTENHPDYVLQALSRGYDVEIDVWRDPANGTLFLGHDEPQYPIETSFLDLHRDRLWCHAKNVHALSFLVQGGFHVFYHDVDHYVLTSRGVIWAYPGQPVGPGIVCVMPERVQGGYADDELRKALGICTDHVALYADRLSR